VKTPNSASSKTGCKREETRAKTQSKEKLTIKNHDCEIAKSRVGAILGDICEGYKVGGKRNYKGKGGVNLEVDKNVNLLNKSAERGTSGRGDGSSTYGVKKRGEKGPRKAV